MHADFPKESPSRPIPHGEWAGQLATANRSPRKIRGYLIDLKQFLEWLGRRDPLTIGEDGIRRFAHAMQAAGLAPRTRARRTTAVREWYKYLVDTKRVERNPAEKIAPPKVPEDDPEYLRPEEVGRLRRVIPRTDRRLRERAAVELGLSTLRISEVLGLNLDDLHLRRRQVRVMGKGGARVFQTVTLDAVRALQAWLERRPVCESEAVFIPLPPRRGLCRLHYTTLEDLLAANLAAAGVTRRIRFHGLRHTAGTTLSDRGVPLQDIQDLLRHKSPKTTRRYARVAKERLAEVLDHELRFPE